RIWHGLSGLRKDNTGYDLKNLFLGSEGPLGIITAAVLKLFPKPRSRVTALIGCASPQHALRLFERLQSGAGDALSGFEFMAGFALDIVLRRVPGVVRPLAAAHDSYVLAELTSPDPDADLAGRLEVLLAAALEEGVIENAVLGTSEAQNQAFWQVRESVPEAQKREGGSIMHDVAV